jgi:hypothetical protein
MKLLKSLFKNLKSDSMQVPKVNRMQEDKLGKGNPSSYGCMEYYDFVVGYATAYKNGDIGKIKELMSQQVQCTFCKTTVEAVKTAQRSVGKEPLRLACPNCTREWIRIG